MPSRRLTSNEPGSARCISSRRAMEREPPDAPDAQAPSESANRIVANEAYGRMRCLLLAVGVEHVLEAHPLLVEVQVHITRTAVSVLPDQQLGRPFDATGAVVHPFPEQREHHVGPLLHRAARPEVVEHGT